MDQADIDILFKIADWFVLEKMPSLADHIEIPLKAASNGVIVEQKWRKTFGFMLFSYAMNQGPSTFEIVEKLAASIGVTSEFILYAQDFLDHPKSKKQ